MTHPCKLTAAVFVAAGIVLAGVAKFHAAADEPKKPAPDKAAADRDEQKRRKMVLAVEKLKAEHISKSDELRNLLVQEAPRDDSQIAEGLKTTDAAVVRLRVRAAELEGELKYLSQAEKAKVVPQAVLLLLWRTEAAKGIATPGEIKNTPPADYVALYAESLRLEQKKVEGQLVAVGNLRSEYAEANRKLRAFRDHEKAIRDDLQKIERLFPQLETKLMEMELSVEKAKQ